MSRTVRLTRRSRDTLVEIARRTVENVGQRQVDIFEPELLTRCQAIVDGPAHDRNCDSFVAGA